MLMALSNYSILFSSFPHSIPVSSKFPILSPMIHSRRQHPVVLKEKSVLLGFSDSKGLGGSIHLLERSYWFESIRRRCNNSEEVYFALEAEILEFMDCSENPNKFPTKKDLINAGRGDLVEAIEKNFSRGGDFIWLSKGWDLDKEVQENEIVDLNSGVEEHTDDRIFQERCFNGGECDSLEGVDLCIVASEDSSSCAPSSSRRQMGKEESVDEDDAGINGILKQLEKERNLSFELNASREKETDISCKNHYEDDWKPGSSMFSDSKPASTTSLNPTTDSYIVSEATGFGKGSTSNFDDMAWSRQRQGLSQLDFEAAEIGTDVATDKDANETGEERSQNLQNDPIWLQSRVEHLEVEDEYLGRYEFKCVDGVWSIDAVLKADPQTKDKDNCKLDDEDGEKVKVQESIVEDVKEKPPIFNDEAEKEFYTTMKAISDSTKIKVGKFVRYLDLLLSAFLDENQRSTLNNAQRELFRELSKKENVKIVAEFCQNLGIQLTVKLITKKFE